MDLNIEENTLKHQNVNVPTEYNISEGIEYYLYTFLEAMHQNMLFCNEFHFSCKNTKGYIL